MRDLIEATGAHLLYLPPYSPDFNPIENMFSKLKALLRKAAERNVEGLWRAIADCIPLITWRECANYLEAAGYERTEGNALAECRIDCANTSRVDAFLSNLCGTTINGMRIARNSNVLM